MYRMSIIALTLPQRNVDVSHAMKLCLVHDLAEAIVGDITPRDNVSKAEKHRLESDAMADIRDQVLTGSVLGHEVFALWNEYEEGNTHAAVFVKQIDKLEMILQADDYERAQGKDLSDFFESTRHAFGKGDDRIVQVVHALREDRHNRRQADGRPSEEA